MDIPALVKKYIAVINHANFVALLQECHDELINKLLINKISHDDPTRAQYFFNDVVAFQVIPELIVAHVVKGYYDEVLVFINEMLENPHLQRFWTRVPADTSLDYYELAVYMALSRTMDDNAEQFTKHVIDTYKLLDNGLA
ncbi:hypothetical protein H4R34_005425, partial [Dimargaris verticillata]